MNNLRKDDLIICKEKWNGEINDSTVFARVTDVDREKGVAYLDRYQKQGRLHYDCKMNAKMSLELIEGEKSYYYRMTDDEILMFCEGLENMRKISQKNGEYEKTLEAVQEVSDSIKRDLYRKNRSDIEL